MTTSSPTNIDYTQEVRFAVVMYGGVSLAIYINGVAQELLHMVRSTASNGAAKLSGTEQVYRRISHLLAEDQDGRSSTDAENDQSGPPPTRFVVDIVSGTSAGGINGVFLAKALANGQSMDSLEGLWIQEGEIQKLLNDNKSIEYPLELQDPPQSLLNSQRMYLQLLKALDGMDDERTAAARSPYVDELDLFVTSTDILGVTLPIRLADNVVYERRHRNVMHFAYSKCEVTGDEDDRNDFIGDNNPFLAYAARCTSAFPFAFEPMRLEDMDSVLQGRPRYKGDDSFKSASRRWEKFYKNYVNAGGLGTAPFPERSFNDGGVLDNKPFTYATETIGHRHADVPVDRKLIYIEPSPEHPELEMERGERPNAIQNVKAAILDLPRAETIRDDLQRVLDRNRLIHRANRIMQGVEADREVAERATKNLAPGPGGDSDVKLWKTLGALAPHPDVDELWAKPNLNDDDWSKLDLADMVKRKGQSYVAYHRLEIAETTDLLANLLARIGGLNDESDYFLIVRGLVRAWRDSFYVEYRGDDQANPAKPTMNSFLVSFGLSYPIRRINFLRAKVDKLYSLDDEAHKILAGHFKGFWDEGTELSDEQRRLFRAALLRIKPKLNEIFISLRRAGRLLRSRPSTEQLAGANEPAKQENPVQEKIAALFKAIREAAARDIAAKEAVSSEPKKESRTPLMDYFLGDGQSAAQTSRNQRRRLSESRLEEECTVRAKALLTDHSELRGLIDEAAMRIAEHVSKARQESESHASDLLRLEFASTSPGVDDATIAARVCLRHYYDNYDDYDMVSFPLFYQTDVGEADVVEVIRVSPEDARLLSDEGTSGCRKLAGTAIGHFGAFLDQLWRKNDILWGRLDGAERIITALLPNHPETRRLIADAQAAIVCEATNGLGQIELHDLLVESLMRSRSGSADDEALKTLSCFLGNLKNYCAPDLKEALEARIRDADLRDYYRKVFKDRSRLEPEPTLRTA